MSDLTREQAIEWCVDNGADFIKPVFPPPNGWAWSDFDIDKESLVLTPIFTVAASDILAVDVIVAYARRMSPAKNELAQQMRGRATYLRDCGEVKTPELLERGANLIAGDL